MNRDSAIERSRGVRLRSASVIMPTAFLRRASILGAPENTARARWPSGLVVYGGWMILSVSSSPLPQLPVIGKRVVAHRHGRDSQVQPQAQSRPRVRSHSHACSRSTSPDGGPQPFQWMAQTSGPARGVLPSRTQRRGWPSWTVEARGRPGQTDPTLRGKIPGILATLNRVRASYICFGFEPE